MTVGERIKSRRKELGMSAEQVAEKLMLSPSTIYRYENGDIEKMGIDKLTPIANVLQCTPEYLMGWSDQEKVENKHYGSLNDTYYRGVQSWINHGFFSADEKTMLKAHCSGMLSRYKELIEGSSNVKHELKLFLKHTTPKPPLSSHFPHNLFLTRY